MDDLGPRAGQAKRKRGTKGGTYEQCVKIVKQLMKMKQAYEFLRPVDWRALGLPDYPEVIKNPMDLGTVLKKLQGGEYSNALQMRDDIELIFDNCEKYNGSDHPITRDGFAVRDAFRKKFAELQNYNFDDIDSFASPKSAKATPSQKKIRPSAPVSGAHSAEVADFTFEEKRQLCIMINNLDQKYLPQVIHIIHKAAPNLLDTESQPGGVEEVEISIDNLQPSVLRELDNLIKTIRQQQSTQSEAGQSLDASNAPLAQVDPLPASGP